jgi:hydroxymethylglutaryl-CoA lyase
VFENLAKQVKVVEVGPRDGLQNEEKHVSTSDKVRLIEALAGAGLKHIEITSFVSAKWIPQLADGLQVAQALNLPAHVLTSALVPNLQGYQAAKEAGIAEISVFMSATNTHSKKNINKTIDEALNTLSGVVEAAKGDNKLVRGYLSVVFACPYEGSVAPERVIELCKRLLAMGVDEISLGDTIGAANPRTVWSLINSLKRSIDVAKIALHFHDTRGTALANVLAGLQSGVSIFDASIGGMGGCPYAPGAAGNLATEDLVYLLDSLGIETGVQLPALANCGRLAEEILSKQLPGRYLRSYLAGNQRMGSATFEKEPRQ